jgi:hypothetical protein
MNPFSWAGLTTEARPRPPKVGSGFKFFRRGFLAGAIPWALLGGLLVALADGVR